MKQTLIILLLLLTCSIGYTQSTKIGILTGLNSSKFKSDLIAGFNNEIGYNIGFLGSKGIADKLNIKSGLVYKTKKTSFEDEITLFDGNAQPVGTQQIKSDFEYGYISIPMFLEYQLSPFVKLSGGPNIDINISDNYSVNVPPFTINEEANPLILGLNIGPSLIFKKFEFNILYNKGISKVSKEAEFAKVLSDETFTGIEFNLAYYFL
jgi:hypothetical protein